MGTNEKEILSQLITGNRKALKQLFDTHYDFACNTAYKFVKDGDLAQDLAQEVFIKLWEKREQININNSFKSYLYRMTSNQALAWMRVKKNQRPQDLDSTSPLHFVSSGESSVLDKELENLLNNTIQNLPERCKMVFTLSRFEDKSYKEIAEIMEISIKTVENQMGKALKTLRVALAEYRSQ